jgi:amino-acid N-acetyltransferase
MILRKAKASDELTIHRLIREAQINPMGVTWERFIVIEAPDGEIAAIGQVKPHRDGSRELASIVTAPAYRGQGLTRRIIEHLVAAHPGVLYLICQSDLEPLYEKFGFRTIRGADLPKYFRRMMRLTGFMQKMAGIHTSVMRRDE